MGFPTANIPVQRRMAVPAEASSRLGHPAGRSRRSALAGGDLGRYEPDFDGVERRVEASAGPDDLELYDVPIAIDFYARLRGQVNTKAWSH